MKKKLCALLLAVLMVIPLSGCVIAMTATTVVLTATVVYDALVPDEQQYARVLRNNWDISLPEGFELICCEEIPGPHGDGLRYALLRYNEPSVLDDFRAWTGEEGTTYFFSSYTRLVEEAIDYLSVQEEFHPDYENLLWWYTHKADTPWDEILMLRDGDLLYIIQSFV